ncbi:MAG: hypothetical protein KKA61_01390, partial [Nanoarchaeota archaeon]|nr:hypothetical protein [Nanoarchaeota archaeon]
KYKTTPNEFFEEITKWDEKKVCEWVYQFLFNGYTSPYAGLGKLQTEVSFLIQLTEENRDNASFRENLEKAVVNCYTKFSDNKKIVLKEKRRIAMTLFELIGEMEINDSFERLKEDASNEKYKGIDAGEGPHVDLHTFLLKGLFGLEKNKEIHSLTQIIDRDIHDLKYSLECFSALYSSAGQEISGIEYMPILVNQIDGANRDVVGDLREYIEILEKADFSCFHEIPKKSLNNEEIKKFSCMLNILNEHIEGYNIQIGNDGLMIHNTENQKITVITITHKLTEEIRSSLNYIPPK